MVEGTGYKKKKVNLGGSDIASLTIRTSSQAFILQFEEDGEYSAWYVDDITVDIPDHYKLVGSFKNWIKIYDDDGLVFDKTGDFEIYRAGMRGCLIRRVKGHWTDDKEE